MADNYRVHAAISNEVVDLVVADIALTVAFALVFSGGLGGVSKPSAFLYYVPIAFIAVTLSFVLHEYMHKIVAQKFGAIAAFKRSDFGILITLLSSSFGFLIGLPGATMIYTNRFTSEEEGYVALAGPLTNFAVFLVFLGIAFLGGSYVTNGYVQAIIATTLFISVWLAFFNMLPMYPLDGSKVLRWNKAVYAITMIVIFAFMYFALMLLGISWQTFFPSLIIILIIAFLMSSIYRSVIFRF